MLEEGAHVRIFDLAPSLSLLDVRTGGCDDGGGRGWPILTKLDGRTDVQEDKGSVLDMALQDGRATYVQGDLRDKSQVLEGAYRACSCVCERRGTMLAKC